MTKKQKPKTQDLEKLSNLFGNLMNFQEVATSFVEDIVEKKHASLTKTDVKKIAQEMLPDIDKLISQKIKDHIWFLVGTLTKAIKKGE